MDKHLYINNILKSNESLIPRYGITNIDTKQSNKRNSQNSKSKKQDYHMK